MPGRSLTAMLMLCMAGVMLVGCATPAKAPPAAVQVNVTRYSGASLSKFQTLALNEATKLSLACRLYRYFYGKWPSDLDAIKARTSGIDYGIFLGKATVTPGDDDSEDVSFFDGRNILETRMTPVDFHFPASTVKAAQAPGYKINVDALHMQAASQAK